MERGRREGGKEGRKGREGREEKERAMDRKREKQSDGGKKSRRKG